MARKILSQNEKIVLFGLTKFPLSNDRELSEVLGLKMSTITAIKNRLKSRNYFFTVRIPFLHNFGCELINVIYGNVHPMTDNAIKMELGKIINDFDRINFAAFDNNKLISVGMSSNFSEAMKDKEMLEVLASEKDLIYENGLNNSVFALDDSEILNFNDFTHLITRTMDLPDNIRNLKPLPKLKTSERNQFKKLTSIEKRVLFGLIKYPDLPDTRIAEKIQTTRQVIAKLRQKFEENGMMKTKRILNLKKLGYEILALTAAKFSTKYPLEKRQKGKSDVVNILPQFMTIESKLENISMSVYENYSEFQKNHAELEDHYRKSGYLREPLNTTLMSIPDMDIIRNHIYFPLVKKILDIDEENLSYS